MKKVLIGCGVLLLLSGIAVVGVVMFVGHKVSGFAHSAQKMTKQMDAQNNQMKKLNAQFPFHAPAEGQPLVLTDDRLQAYLAVREAALPIFESFKTQSDALNAKYKNAGGMAALSGAAEGMGMLSDLTLKLRASYAKSLEDQKMSPDEFGAITGAIYSSAMGAAMAGQHDVAQKQLAKIDEQLKTTTDPQMKAALEQEKTTFQQMAANAPDPKTSAVYVANAKLTDKYKDRIQKAVNPAFDVFVMNGDQFEKQMQVGAGHHG